MYVLAAEAIRRLDEQAEALGVSPELLMESAARGGAERVRSWLGDVRNVRVVALCGPGGNGGDALGMLRWLALWGANPFAVVLGAVRGATEAQECAYRATCPGSFLRVEGPEELALLEGALSDVDLVLDGILGVGVKGPARGLPQAAIELLRRQTNASVVSVDLPSGLVADTGAVEGPAVHADLTLAMGALKPCHLLGPAADLCGQVELVPVAYPPSVWEEIAPLAEVMTHERCAVMLPRRPRRGHKGTFGRVLVIGGAMGMAGAVVLAAEGAMRAGAGLVHVLCPESVYEAVAGMLPAALVHPVPAAPDGGFAPEAAGRAVRQAQEADVVLIGPGLGRGPMPVQLLRDVFDSPVERLVVDADGLHALAQELTRLPRRTGELVVTPHPREFARLVGREVTEVDNDKITWTRRASREWRSVVVFKGPPTAIGLPEGGVRLATRGNTALAHGGSGDILAGIIAGLWAGGAPPGDAAAAGAFVHGLAAEIAVEEAAARTVTPTEILATVGKAFAQVERPAGAP